MSWPKGSRSVQQPWQGRVPSPMIFNYLLTACGDEPLVITKEKAKFGDFISVLTAFLDFAADLGYNQTQRIFAEIAALKRKQKLS